MKNQISAACLASLLSLNIGGVHGLGRLWDDLKPRSFKSGDQLDVHVGQLWSYVVGALPYDFYSLEFCESTEGHQYQSGILKDEKTFADNNDTVNTKLHESPYQYWVGEDKNSIIACNRYLSQEQHLEFVDMIWNVYRYQLFIDDLPSATMLPNAEGVLEPDFREGIYIGKHE